LYTSCSFRATAHPATSPLSLHDALPILLGLMDELAAVRAASVALFAGLPQEAWVRDAVVGGTRTSVRALACIIAGHELHHRDGLDRKSTRLNSSHVKNSYAVFCLKKKTA